LDCPLDVGYWLWPALTNYQHQQQHQHFVTWLSTTNNQQHTPAISYQLLLTGLLTTSYQLVATSSNWATSYQLYQHGPGPGRGRRRGHRVAECTAVRSAWCVGRGAARGRAGAVAVAVAVSVLADWI
jgi:hypothetical protein